MGEKGRAWAAKVWQAIVQAWTKLVDWVKGRFHQVDTEAEGQETVVLPASEPAETGGGKRVRRSQQRKEQQKKTQRYILIGLCAVVLIAYLVLCGTVCKEYIFPNTKVNGQDLSGMTLQEAEDVLTKGFQEQYADAALTVKAEGKSYTVDMSKALDLKADEAAERAFAHGHTGFFRRGLVWLFSHIKGYHKTVYPHIKDEKAMQTSVKDCGVLKVDTAVADSYKVTKNQITFTHGTSGQAVDKDALYESITEAVDSGDYETVISAPMKDSQPKALDIDKVYKKVYTKAKDATLDPKNNYAIVASTTGVSFDKKEAAAAIEGLEEGESKSISLKLTTADITTQNLEKNLFKDRLGGYSTNVAGTAARINNVRLAGQHCNNTILLPGETFSYNEVVGQRTAARGFQEAGAYLNGKTVQELGGGICQVSSTLYCATVLSNLEIVHRENHMFESTYVPLGLDATVSWGGPDYVFKNNTKYPIKVVAGYANGVCTCEIWGTKTDNITVKFVNEVLSRNPYSTVTVKDDTKPVGYSTVTEEGENGSKVQTYRELYDGSGKLISRTKESFSVYTRRNQVVTVGTKKAEQKKKKTKKTDKKKNEQKQDTDQTAG